VDRVLSGKIEIGVVGARIAQNYLKYEPLMKDEMVLVSPMNHPWAEAGILENIEDLQGAITDVPPTRLREISQLNRQSKDWESPVFPVVKFEDQFRLQSGGNYPNVCG